MTNEFISAKTLLESKGISLLYAARLICNALDYMPRNSTLTPIQFCSKIIEAGQRHVRIAEMSLAEGFALYLKSKQHLRKDSFNDIRYLGNRLSRAKPELVERNFSELSASECEEWLNAAFHTDTQFKRSANEISPQAKDPKGETAHKVSASQVLKAYRPITKLLKAMYLPLGNLKKPSAKEPNKLTRRSLVWN